MSIKNEKKEIIDHTDKFCWTSPDEVQYYPKLLFLVKPEWHKKITQEDGWIIDDITELGRTIPEVYESYLYWLAERTKVINFIEFSNYLFECIGVSKEEYFKTYPKYLNKEHLYFSKVNKK